MSRVFLTRQEATYLMGLMCASQVNQGLISLPVEADVRLACRADGIIYEAKFGELLHAQIILRIPARSEPASGWTVDGDWYASTRPRSGVDAVMQGGPFDGEWYTLTRPLSLFLIPIPQPLSALHVNAYGPHPSDVTAAEYRCLGFRRFPKLLYESSIVAPAACEYLIYEYRG